MIAILVFAVYFTQNFWMRMRRNGSIFKGGVIF